MTTTCDSSGAGAAPDPIDTPVVHLHAEELRSILSIWPDGLCRFAEDGKIIEANDVYCEMSGYSRAELLNLHLQEVQVAGKPDDLTRHIAQVLDTGFDRFATQHRKKSGEVFDVEISAVRCEGTRDVLCVIRDVTGTRLVLDGKPCLLGAAVDLSKRKSAEDALRQSEQRLALKNRIANIFLTVSDDGMFSEVLQVIQNATRSQHGLFGYIDEEGALACPSLTQDIWTKCQMPTKSLRFAPESWGGIWGRALKEKRILFSNEECQVPQGHLSINRVLVSPIQHRDEVIGLLMVANKASDYDDCDKDQMERITGQLAPVLHARLQRNANAKSDLYRALQTIVTNQNSVIPSEVEGPAVGAVQKNRSLDFASSSQADNSASLEMTVELSVTMFCNAQ